MIAENAGWAVFFNIYSFVKVNGFLKEFVALKEVRINGSRSFIIC